MTALGIRRNNRGRSVKALGEEGNEVSALRVVSSVGPPADLIAAGLDSGCSGYSSGGVHNSREGRGRFPGDERFLAWCVAHHRAAAIRVGVLCRSLIPAEKSAHSRSARLHGWFSVTRSLGLLSDPTAAPVVFLPGGQTRHAWGKTARSLGERGGYAVSMDLRGYGESGWARDGNTLLEAYISDLSVVVESFERLPAVVGASLGGITGPLVAGHMVAGERFESSTESVVDFLKLAFEVSP